MSFLNLGILGGAVMGVGKRGLGAIHWALRYVSDAKSLEAWILKRFEHYVVLDNPKVELNELSIEVSLYW